MEPLGTTGKRIVLVGDSAGGNLVLALALKVRTYVCTYLGLGSYLSACGLLLYIEYSYCTYVHNGLYMQSWISMYILHGT